MITLKKGGNWPNNSLQLMWLAFARFNRQSTINGFWLFSGFLMWSATQLNFRRPTITKKNGGKTC